MSVNNTSSNICPCAKPRFEDFINLQYVYINVAKFFLRLELWVDVPVGIFFPTLFSMIL